MATLESARITVEDVGASLRDYAGGIEASPEHLAEVEDRLAALDRLKRKYGPTLEDVIKHWAYEVSRKLREMENKDEVLRQLRAGAGDGGGAISGCGPRDLARSATKPPANWRSWSKPRSTIWP